jgi:hypothetical protein
MILRTFIVESAQPLLNVTPNLEYTPGTLTGGLSQLSGLFQKTTATAPITPNNAKYGAKTVSLLTGVTTPPTGPAGEEY